jgi:hypothetical protein
MIKHPLHKLGKKNRNVISGLLVGFASIFLIMFYLQVPAGQVGRFLLASAGFVLLIIIAAILFMLSIKLVMRLFTGADDSEDESSPYPPSPEEPAPKDKE